MYNNHRTFIFPITFVFIIPANGVAGAIDGRAGGFILEIRPRGSLIVGARAYRDVIAPVKRILLPPLETDIPRNALLRRISFYGSWQWALFGCRI